MPSSASAMGQGMTGGNKAAAGFDAAASAAQNLDGVLKSMDKSLDSILSKIGQMSKSGFGAGGSLGPGLGSSTGSKFSNDVAAGIAQMQAKLDQAFTIKPTTGDRLLRVGELAAVGAGAAMGMMPNTTDAVSQRITAQGVASMSGMSANNLIASSNALLAGGMTSPQSGAAATSILASRGILPTMGSYKNTMNQVGGLSVLTGMSNEQVASGIGSINGMNFLRMGVRARNPDGSLRPITDISSDLYRRMYGNRKITAEQASQVFNPNTRTYQDVMAAAGGNQELFQTMATNIVYQARNGGKTLDVSPQNVKDKLLNLPGNDPMRAFYKYQESEAKKLQTTGDGLVSGYGMALSSTASVNNLFSSIAKFAGPIANGLEKLKGILDILPQAGNTGATLTGIGANIGSRVFGNITANLEKKGIDSFIKALGVNAPTPEEQILNLLKSSPVGPTRTVGGSGLGLMKTLATSALETRPWAMGGGGGGDSMPLSTLIPNLSTPFSGSTIIHGPNGERTIYTPGEGSPGASESGGSGDLQTLFGKVGKESATARDAMGLEKTTLSSLLSKEGRAAAKATAAKAMGMEASTGMGALLKGGLKLGGKAFLTSGMGTMLAAQAIDVAGNLATPALRSWGAKHGVSRTMDRLGTTALRAGQYAAEGALIGSAIPVVGTVAGALLGTAYGAFKGWQETKQAPNTGGGGEGGSVHNPGSSTATSKGPKTIRPTGGSITAWYGQKPKNNSYWQWKGYHTGTDFGVPKGTSVVSYKDGKVAKAGWSFGDAYGNAVLVDHGDHQSFYAHLSSIGVHEGQKVTAGQQIALSGQSGTGAKAGPHLHFEIRKGKDNPIDPKKYLKGLIASSPIVAGKEEGGHGKSTLEKVGDAIGNGVSLLNPISSIKSLWDKAFGNDKGQPGGMMAQGQGALFSTDNTGFNASSSGGTTTLAPALGGSSNAYGGDVGPSTSTEATAGMGHNCVINMNVTVSHGNTQDAVRLAREVKSILERDLRVHQLGDF